MKELLMQATIADMSPEELQQKIQNSDSPEMNYRRGITVVSLVGVAAIGIVSLLQMGIVKHLPDPPVKNPTLTRTK